MDRMGLSETGVPEIKRFQGVSTGVVMGTEAADSNLTAQQGKMKH